MRTVTNRTLRKDNQRTRKLKKTQKRSVLKTDCDMLVKAFTYQLEPGHNFSSHVITELMILLIDDTKKTTTTK